MRRVRHSRQRGSAMLMVMILGTVAAIIAGALIQHDAVAERRAVSESLARARAYWAAMGEMNYALSRIRNASGCNDEDCDDDAERTAYLLGYIREACRQLTPTCGYGGTALWTYPESGSDYFIPVAVIGAPEGLPGYNSRSGHMKMTATFPTAGESTLPVLNGLASRMRPVELRYCMVDPPWTACGNPANNLPGGGESSNRFFVKAIDRAPLF